MQRSLSNPEIRQSLLTMGAEPATEGQDEFRALLRDETERWAVIARKASVRVE